MNKQVIITVVLILLAAAAFTWWDASQKAERNLAPSQKYAKWKPVRISEPPISEQIEAQIKSIETGKTVPLPIPLYIAGEKIDRLDVEWLREKLKGLGYEETEVKTEFPEVELELANAFESFLDEYAYTNPAYREILLLNTLDSAPGTGMEVTVIMGFDKHSAWVDGEPDILAVSKRAGEGFGLYVGQLHIGISWSEVERELANLPSYTMKEGPLASTLLQRGKYRYTFVSNNGKLDNIGVTSSDFEHLEKLKEFSDERRRKFITSMFENDFDKYQ